MSARHAHHLRKKALRRGTSLSLVGGASMLLGFGCAVTQLGATPADLDRARAQADVGATVFANECARCHGQRGEGSGGVSAILGPGALPEFPRNSGGSADPTVTDPQLLQIQAQGRPAGAAWRDSFRSAQDVFNFTSTQMPKGRGGSLGAADYWAVVNFIFAAQGATLPAGGIGPSNASSVQVPPR